MQESRRVSESVTGVVVSYNSRELLERMLSSVHRFHPDMRIVVIDGSDQFNPCRKWLARPSSSSDRLGIVLCDSNIGHGRGMDLALKSYVKTPYALLMDSDIEMVDSPVAGMLEMMEQDTYGVGWIETTGLDGYEYGAHPHHKTQESMRYLHPYFALISVKRYGDFYPFVHHGAPCYLAMLDIHKSGQSEKIIKGFPGLGHTGGVGWTWKANPDLKYVRHDTRGTRDVRLAARQGEIEPGWVWNRGLV